MEKKENMTPDEEQMSRQIQSMGKGFNKDDFFIHDVIDAREFIETKLKEIACIEKIDEPTKDHIDDVIEWLESDYQWGLILMGSVGNGKTSLMRAIMAYFDWIYSSNNYPVRTKKAKEITNAAIKGLEYNEYSTVLAIDDLGEEPKEVMCFGNIQTPIIDIIEERYDNLRLTIFTTNLDEEGITKKYGARIADRLREMATVITFTNPSYR